MNIKEQVNMSKIFDEIMLGDEIPTNQLPFKVQLDF